MWPQIGTDEGQEECSSRERQSRLQPTRTHKWCDFTSFKVVKQGQFCGTRVKRTDGLMTDDGCAGLPWPCLPWCGVAWFSSRPRARALPCRWAAAAACVRTAPRTSLGTGDKAQKGGGVIRAGTWVRGGDAASRDGARAWGKGGWGACGYRTFDVAEGRVRRDQAHVA